MLERGTDFAGTKAAFSPRRWKCVSWDVFTSGSVSVEQMFRQHSLKWKMLDSFLHHTAPCPLGHILTYTHTGCFQRALTETSRLHHTAPYPMGHILTYTHTGCLQSALTETSRGTGMSSVSLTGESRLFFGLGCKALDNISFRLVCFFQGCTQST